MPIYTYNPSQVNLFISGYKLSGFTSISVSFDSKQFRTVRGIRGANARVQDKNSSCTITVTVLQTSITNNVLSRIHELDRQFGTGRLEVSLQDNSGANGTKSLLESDTGYIENYPDFEFSEAAGTREWVINCLSSRNIMVGSNFKPALDLF